jgi:hypothetical protein
MNKEQPRETPMNITVELKNVYGNRLIYPVCEQAQLFAKLVGTKTLTTQHVDCIKKLGYTVEVATPTL